MFLSACIDWLSMSGGLSLGEQLAQTKFGFSLGSELTGIARYPTGYKLSPAGTLFISDGEQQGSLLTLSGQDMQVLRDRSGDDGMTLAELLPISKPTRLDYALDIHSQVNIRLLETHIKQGKHKTKFKSPPIAIAGLSEDGGYTIYFGSPKSDRRIRIYDKAKQLKLLKQAWYRVELQVRRKRAVALAGDMFKLGWEHVGKAAIRDCLDFPACGWWSEAFECDDIELSKIPRKPTSWQHWLETQVKPSIVAHAENISDRVFLEDWMLRLQDDIITTWKGT